MSELKGACIIGQSGGPSAVINASAYGAIKTALENPSVTRVLGDAAPKTVMSSTKSAVGHLLGAAGSVEAIFCLQAIAEGYIPPTINLEKPDPELTLDYVPNEGRKAELTYAMSNSLGFGGHNGTLIVKRYEE